MVEFHTQVFHGLTAAVVVEYPVNDIFTPKTSATSSCFIYVLFVFGCLGIGMIFGPKIIPPHQKAKWFQTLAL